VSASQLPIDDCGLPISCNHGLPAVVATENVFREPWAFTRPGWHSTSRKNRSP